MNKQKLGLQLRNKQISVILSEVEGSLSCLRRDRHVREFARCRRTWWELPEASVPRVSVTGSFDSVNASLREAFTTLRMTGSWHEGSQLFRLYRLQPFGNA